MIWCCISAISWHLLWTQWLLVFDTIYLTNLKAWRGPAPLLLFMPQSVGYLKEFSMKRNYGNNHIITWPETLSVVSKSCSGVPLINQFSKRFTSDQLIFETWVALDSWDDFPLIEPFEGLASDWLSIWNDLPRIFV